ncbi:T9SS type A sorting domain-containing protein [Mucilaginibacter sp.]|uniref:beta strand repeat-containing protein n=1 Tax=Mucilaginibacter sp. TaxID=1882438 RepID=UPI00283CFE77|nr:T9SS type A sorting domain-containing protein [Mucilaginibacter sp.]MDR3693253.1 T9SS type A sorting domain-containing protein [Mucilaginibacter sp.]
MKTRILPLIIALSVFIGVQKSDAQITYTWQGGTSGSWNTPSNWSVLGITQILLYPGSLLTTDIAVIGTSNSAVTNITYTGTHTIAQIQTNGYSTNGIAITFTGTTPTLNISNGLNIGQQNGSMVGLAFSGSGTASIGGTSSFGYQQSMSIASGTTVSFISGSTLDFTNNQGTLTNNGTLNFTSSTFKLGYNATLSTPGTVIANSTDFNMSNASAYITYGGKFVANSCTFEIPSGAYIKSTSASSAFTTTGSTFAMTGSGGGAYIYNNGTYKDHASTYNMSGQAAYLQNVSGATMSLRGATVNFSTSTGANAQYINNAGTFTIDSASTINAATYQCYITNSGTFYAGTSGSSCIITLSGQGANVANTGTFKLGSTSIIYPSSYQANVTNTSPGVFTLQSDANGTAAIGALSSTATCTGTFNTERYFQGSTTYDNTKKRWLARNYRIISSPVYNSTQVNSNNVYGLNYIVGATAGLTTTANSATNAFITGCTGGSTSAGNPSIYLYRESYTPSNATFTSGNYLGITNIANSSTSGTITASDGGTYSIPVGNGVFFFFRGAATNWSTRTVSPYIAPENVTLTSTGNINQQSITVKDWYSPTLSSLGYTGSGTTGNYNVRGYNMVGNPYPCTIDWCTAYSGTGITRTNINPTIYVYNPVTNQFDSYLATSSSGGTGTGNGSRYIMSGQGFFVQANTTGASLVFTESAKAAAMQLTGGNLLMGTPATQTAGNQLLRLKFSIDSLNYDDIVIGFNASASAKYNVNEDAAYIKGMNAMEGLSSFSDDSVKLAVNFLPLPKLNTQVIRLNVEAAQTGRYTFQKTALNSIPQLYEIWLMDKLKKDSLDIRNNSTYAFDVDLKDTTTYGSNRFQLVIRQNPALMVHLLNFTGAKTSDGAQITWKTENEENYTNFTVERSSDGGINFNALGGAASNALGTYSFLDKNPPVATDMYRLKIVDLNGTASYSNIVTLMYSNTTNTLADNISIYPNPVSTMINLGINQPAAVSQSGISSLHSNSIIQSSTAITSEVSYNIRIVNITGSVVKSATTNQTTWQDNVGNLLPGTYIIQVTKNKDNSIVGKATFIKL